MNTLYFYSHLRRAALIAATAWPLACSSQNGSRDTGPDNTTTGGTNSAGSGPVVNDGSGGTPANGGASSTGGGPALEPAELLSCADEEYRGAAIIEDGTGMASWGLNAESGATVDQTESTMIEDGVIHISGSVPVADPPATVPGVSFGYSPGWPLDAKAKGYVGLRFRARAIAGDKLGVSIADRFTYPEEKICTEKCYDYFFTSVDLTSDWDTYFVHFSDFSRMEWPLGGWADPATDHLDPTGIYQLSFLAHSRIGTSGSFDYEIDDIEWVECGQEDDGAGGAPNGK